MRVSTDPNDYAYDPRPRKVWCNGVEIENWTWADEFRRGVGTAAGTVHGSVLIERLPVDESQPAPQPLKRRR